jgi:hypothetical protein
MRENETARIFTRWTCPGRVPAPIMLSMSATPDPRSTATVRRVVLVPASPSSSRGRGDELVRRYRLARMRVAGSEATAAANQARIRGG